MLPHPAHHKDEPPGTPDCLSNGIQTRKANNLHCIILFETVGLEFETVGLEFETVGL